ncbi:MAG: hypothetical protein LBQ40_01305, partial [Clostridiales bacterium]|nr:hypothetical protein [Clostridiales bacterium]
MKKYLKVFVITCLLVISGLTLSSCEWLYGYRGKNPELQSVAANSLLPGLYNRRFDRVEILEKDDYGRTLFSYHQYPPNTRLLNALAICQKSDDKYTYFYTDYNFVVVDEFILPDEWAEVKGGDLAEEIELLKEKNDWGKEIREDLLIKAPIKNSKKLPMSNRKLRNIFES